MLKMTRGAMLALTALVAVPVGFAVAKPGDHRGWHAMSPETRARLDDGKLAMAKTALRLTPDQEKLWAPVEAEVKAMFKARTDKMAERQKIREERNKAREDRKAGSDDKTTDTARPDISERIEKMSTDMSERAERMKAFSGAFKPFYAALTDEQKQVLRPLMRDMMPGGGRGGMKGRHGGHWGSKWAHGGGKWGHGHGGGRHGERGEGRGPGGGPGDGSGEGRGDGSGGGAGSGDRKAPDAPNFAPEIDGDEDGIGGGDRL